jgi:hypothetical protein
MYDMQTLNEHKTQTAENGKDGMAKQASCTQVLIPRDRAPDVWINFLPLFWFLDVP